MKKVTLFFIVIVSNVQKVNDFDKSKAQSFLMKFVIDQTIRDMETSGMFY